MTLRRCMRTLGLAGQLPFPRKRETAFVRLLSFASRKHLSAAVALTTGGKSNAYARLGLGFPEPLSPQKQLPGEHV